MASFPLSPSCTVSPSSPLLLSMAIPSTLSPINIKLDRFNYLFWKSLILPAAKAQDLETFMFGTKPKPDETIMDSGNSAVLLSNSEYISWKRLDQFFMSWLLSLISDQM